MLTDSPSRVWTLLLAALVSVWTVQAQTKSYSYVCLEYNQTLCMAISPGIDGEPSFDPNNIYYLQVKDRLRNEEQMLDYKKMRWDLNYGNGKISLTNFTDLCATKVGNTNYAALFPCNATYPKIFNAMINYGKWNLAPFKTDPNGAGLLMLAGNSHQCLTAMRCDLQSPSIYCNLYSQQPAYSNYSHKIVDLRAGSYLKFETCYNAPGGDPGLKNIQVFRAQLDCAPGCPPVYQSSGICYAACNTAKCNWGDGACITKSPTKQPTATPTPPTTHSPTLKITSSPTTHAPTTPTTFAPTTKVTTHAPSGSPTIQCPTAALAVCNAARTKRQCATPAAKKVCTWCLGGCRPSADPRSCTVPGIWDNCLPACPTTAALDGCSKITSRGTCKKSKLGCTYCGKTPLLHKCQPGRDARICANTNFYSYCSASG